jgi:dihydrofolate synthase/folylpolyglutamate synthase
MHYAAAGEYLKKIQGENCKLSLANIRRIIARLPFDAGAVKYVQVAGTNGKGSTAHFIASILRSAGWRVGIFTSPHLQDVRERIQVNGRLISRNDFARAVSAVHSLSRELIASRVLSNLPTFFETLFLAALFHFVNRGADWAVLEVGLGGRLDATSTVIPEVSVITNISRDHTDILGKTLAAIAREKAGIIRKNVPLVSGCPPRSVAGRIIRARARSKKAPLIEVFDPPTGLRVEKKAAAYLCSTRSIDREYRFRVVQKGRHQTLNAAVAVRAIDVLRRRGWEIGEAAVARGIRAMFIPARIEVFNGRPPLILDGGHNSAGIKVLAEYLQEEGLRGFTLIFGVLKDKHYQAMARQLAPLAAHVILTAPRSERALPPEKLLPFFRGKNCRIEMNYSRALAVAKKLKRTIIVCGSLYLAGEMRTIALGGKKYGRQKIQGD